MQVESTSFETKIPTVYQQLVLQLMPHCALCFAHEHWLVQRTQTMDRRVYTLMLIIMVILVFIKEWCLNVTIICIKASRENFGLRSFQLGKMQVRGLQSLPFHSVSIHKDVFYLYEVQYQGHPEKSDAERAKLNKCRLNKSIYLQAAAAYVHTVRIRLHQLTQAEAWAELDKIPKKWKYEDKLCSRCNVMWMSIILIKKIEHQRRLAL